LVVSVIVPVFDPPVDILRAALESALTQTYEHLELCIANAGADPACRAVIDELAGRDHRVRVSHLDENRGISANTNAALQLARGDYVLLLDHDDLLEPNALEAVVEAIVDDPLVDVLYSDEDRLSPGGERVLPYLKPEWSPEFLHSYMWVGHLVAIRRSLLLRIGGFRSDYDGSQDYDVMLRLAAERSTMPFAQQGGPRASPSTRSPTASSTHWAKGHLYRSSSRRTPRGPSARASRVSQREQRTTRSKSSSLRTPN
jgi:glycosyltransferase involved in cell wall biosynthesis